MKDFNHETVSLWLRSYAKECDTEDERFSLETLARCIELGHVEFNYRNGELEQVKQELKQEARMAKMAVDHARASKAYVYHGQGCEYCHNV